MVIQFCIDKCSIQVVYTESDSLLLQQMDALSSSNLHHIPSEDVNIRSVMLIVMDMNITTVYRLTVGLSLCKELLSLQTH